MAPRITVMVMTVLMGLGVLFVSSAPSAGADVFTTRTFNLIMSSTTPAITVDSEGFSFDNIRLVMQSDGNFVLYRVTYTPSEQLVAIWHTATWGNPGAKVHIQTDGHIFVRNAAGQLIYSNGVWGNSGTILVLSGDGRLVVYGNQSQILWQSNSGLLSSLSRAPFDLRKADDSSHDYFDNEFNATQEAEWRPRFQGAGGENAYEPSNLTFTEADAGYAGVDIWYKQVPNSQLAMGAAADAVCQTPLSGNKCDTFQIRFGADLVSSHPHIKNNAVCHEVGHTVGFNDGGLQATSCMTGGMTTRLNGHEISVNLNGIY